MGLSISINEAAAFDVTIAIPGPAGPGVPTGGLSGQILSKASNANYDTSWVNITDVSAVWGQITGSLSNQIDLSNALAAKYDASNPAGYITSAALAPYITSATAASTYYPLTNPAGYISGVNWGSIGGSITSQLDLQTALGGKADLTGATFTGGISTQSGSNIIGIDPLGTWVQITDGTDAISLSPSGITYPDLTVQTTAFTGTAASTWGQIGGLLANQTDLSTELSGKAPAAAGIPVGGITGQLLAKASNNNYDSAWTTVIPGDRYLSTSSTSLLIGNGTKTLTIGTGLSYSATQDITVALTSDPNNYHMHGKVTSYVAGTGVLVIDVQSHTGSGTFNAWTVNVGGLSPVTSLAWGNITGTLSAQTDLQTALDGKYSTSNPAGYITSSALTPYLLSSTAASTYYPLSNPSGYITSSALSPYLLSSTAASTYQTQAGMSSYLTTSAAATTYYPLVGNPSGFLTSAPVTSVAGKTGAVTLNNTDISGLGTMATQSASAYALLSGATFTGNIIRGNSTIASGFLKVGTATTGTFVSANGFESSSTDDSKQFLIYRNLGGTGYPIANQTPAYWINDFSDPNNIVETFVGFGKFWSRTSTTSTPGTWVEPYVSTSALAAYAPLAGAAFTGPVTNATSTISARRLIGQPSAGVAGVNIGVGGDQTSSTTAGDMWIATGGTLLNYRDATGSWRQVLTTSQTGVIDVSSATAPALRVTQRGAGEAFRVEDSTTPDATAFVIDANGKVGVGVAPDANAAITVDGNGIKFGSNAVVQAVSAVVTATGTYDKEIPVTINGLNYRIPCRQV